MTKYIPLDALIAEISQRIEDYKSHKIDDSYHDGLIFALEDLRGDFINTLEVKEVDLEKEIGKYISDKFFDSETMGFFAARTKEEPNDIDMALCAKHFFELGLLSTITEEDCKLIWNIGDNLPYMPEEDFFKELLRRYKAQKGK